MSGTNNKKKRRGGHSDSSTNNEKPSVNLTSLYKPAEPALLSSYMAAWEKTQILQQPDKLPVLVDVMHKCLDDHVKHNIQIDQTEFNMLTYSLLNLLAKRQSLTTTNMKEDEEEEEDDISKLDKHQTDDGGDNNGFPKRRCATYKTKIKTEDGYHQNLPFNPRDPLMNDPEDESGNSLVLVSDAGVSAKYEYPFFLMTSHDISVMDFLYPNFKNDLAQDKLRDSVATHRHQHVDATAKLAAKQCMCCRQSSKKVSGSYKCHRICCSCVYVRVLRGYVWCPVVDCASQLNLAQLGSIYSYLRKKINNTQMPVKIEKESSLAALSNVS